MTGSTPSPSAAGPYYIRTRGRVQGPLSAAKLKLLRARGQFGRAAEVSLDGLIWSPASAFPELFEGITPTQGAVMAELATSTDDSQRSQLFVEASFDRAPLNWKPVAVAGTLLSLSVVAVIVAWLAVQSDRGLATSMGDAPIPGATPEGTATRDNIAPSEPAAAIGSATDPADEAAREDAVGLVVCGFTMELADGTTKEIATGRGTSFLISPQGIALTNKHVVEPTTKLIRSENARKELQKELEGVLKTTVVELKPQVWVFFDGVRESADIDYVSPKFDMALLRTDYTGRACFALAAKQVAVKSTRVYALGFPGAADLPGSTEENRVDSIAKSVAILSPTTDLHVEQLLTEHSYESTLSDGLISRKPYEETGALWIQHTAPINPGNSGGPLLLDDGSVVGINTLLAADAQGIFVSLAIPQLREEIDAHAVGVEWR